MKKQLQNSIFHQIIELIKKNQMKITDLKNKITEMKNSVYGFNIRIDTIEKKVVTGQ